MEYTGFQRLADFSHSPITEHVKKSAHKIAATRTTICNLPTPHLRSIKAPVRRSADEVSHAV